jgi:hypothetical protein
LQHACPRYSQTRLKLSCGFNHWPYFKLLQLLLCYCSLLLLQAAEVAFQQGEDLYMIGGHALASAMELHARIILADKNKEDPPQGFKWWVGGAC